MCAVIYGNTFCADAVHIWTGPTTASALDVGDLVCRPICLHTKLVVHLSV